MFKTIDYRKTRALQICIVFATTLLIQSLLDYSHAGWIGFAVMMIYAGFYKSASIHRTIHRFWGALFGLILSYFLWILGQINYRFILIIIPIIVYMAYFTLGKRYAFPTVFTVTLTALGTDYYGGNQYAVADFFFDYSFSTVVAFLICMLFEYYVFKGSHLLEKFLFELKKEVLANLNELLDTVARQPVGKAHYLKISTQLNIKILELHAFVDTVKHDKQVRINFLEDLTAFNSAINQAYFNIRKLFVSPSLKNTLLLSETSYILERLASSMGNSIDKENRVTDY